jgi:hypothetical protein
MTDLTELIRRRSGTVAAITAVVSFALGVVGAYRFVDAQSTPQILLRQATESDPMASFDGAPGASGILVLLRNDSTTAIEVINSAFSRTSAAPPLYLSAATVAPGAEVNVYVPVPGACFAAISPDSPPSPPVQILVSAHVPGQPIESVPVEVVGQLAQILTACHSRASS